ncbi:MAG: 2-hydroxyacyl-CoA dehydratase family protein, partial [Deltaproteobacteria bacterium]|nr:2-hydroxyacyl-CoA dehydratase family protein [Deltaproteobacteria bacterium]
RLIEEFSLDGIVFHSDRSCKPYSIGQYIVKEEVTKRTGKPGLIIEADMNDPRAFSDAQFETRAEAFLEGFER